jgi:hypothetical protein
MLSNAPASSQLQFEKHARALAGGIFATRCRKKLKAAVIESVETRGGRARNARAAVFTKRMPAKRKSPALPGFDEFYFCSVHFASLAI